MSLQYHHDIAPCRMAVLLVCLVFSAVSCLAPCVKRCARRRADGSYDGCVHGAPDRPGRVRELCWLCTVVKMVTVHRTDEVPDLGQVKSHA